MDVTLVTAPHNNEVHGTFNGKKTGCGINLMKPENATRYRRGSMMTDLGELTCAKCKTKIAKEMIKSDSKEMKELLKEERMRAKKGIEDAGIVPLGNTTAKITKAPTAPAPQKPQVAPEPEPEYTQPAANIPAPAPGAPALDAELAKFAINAPHSPENSFPSDPEPAPAPAPADDFMSQFAVQPPQPAQPEPAPAPVDDFMSQFAVQPPQPAQPEPAPAPVDDFMAQFAIPAQPAEPAYTEPAPAAPPVIDDVSAALAAMQTPVNPYPAQPAYGTPAPAQNGTEWDSIANQIFGGGEAAPAPQPPVIDDISAAINAAQAPVASAPAPVAPEPAPADDFLAQFAIPAQPVEPAYTEPVMPAPTAPQPAVIDDISAAINAVQAPVAPAPAPVAPAAPVIDDISAAINAVQAPVAPAPAPVAPAAPVIDDISAAINAVQAPVAPAPAPVPVAPAAPVIDDISAAINAVQAPVAPAPAPVAPAAPVIDDISAAISAAQAAQAAKPIAPAAPNTTPGEPVIDDISAAINATQNVVPEPVLAPSSAPDAPSAQPAPVDALFDALDSFVQPVQAAPVQPAPVKPAEPTPAPAGMPGVGQVISVPQITGYDANNQPVYAYIQMQIKSYDAKGQPVLVPLPGQNIPIPQAPDTFTPRSALDKNIRLKDAMAAAMEMPTNSRDMTPGQRIAAANAAKGDPVSANVSKIATNTHTKQTSQAFINAISVSKEYANQSLTETQGLQQRTAVLGSIEDVLSQFGDNSLKEKKLAEQAAAAQAPVVDEYKGPVRTYSTRSAPKPAAPQQMYDAPMTKAELKAMKKQEKIDAKFQKEMAKRGR